MKKFTKLFAIILTLSLSIAMLSGCTIIQLDQSGNANVGGGIANYDNDVTVNVLETNKVNYGSIVEMLEETRPTVYEVYAKQNASSSISCGSGTVIGDNIPTEPTEERQPVTYFILTCHHVIDTTDVFMVKDIYGNEFSAQLIGGDPDSDIAVICFTPEEDGYQPVEGKLNEFTKDGKTVTIKKATVRLEKNADGTDSNPIKVGERVFAIGNPLGTLGGTVSQGIISSTDREITVEGKKMVLLQTDCAINSGNSGGGLFDEQGNLVGVVNAGYSGDVEGLNFAIPPDIAFDMFNQLVSTYNGVNYGYIEGRANFQLALGNLTSGADLAVYQYSESFFGDPTVYVTEVAPIFSGKFYVNDVIKSVKVRSEKEHKVSTATALINYINGLDYSIGDTITFTIVRNKQETTVEITLVQYIYKNTGNFEEV